MDIPFEIPYTRILTRLGYKKSTSTMLSCQLEAVKSVIEEAAGYIALKGTYIIQDFKPAEHGIELESGDIITGTLPAKLNESGTGFLVSNMYDSMIPLIKNFWCTTISGPNKFC